MTSLSIDILLDILDKLENTQLSDLLALCRVNKVVSHHALDLLYHTLVLSKTNIFQICTTLVRNPHLADRVRRLEISRHVPENNESLTAIGNALRCTGNLRILRVYLCLSHSWFLRDCIGYFQLHSFHSELPCEDDLVSFLNGQPSLKELTLSRSLRLGCTIDQSCLPELENLSAPMSWVETLVNGRPIRSLEIMTMSPSSPDISAISGSTSSVERLRIPSSYIRSIDSSRLRKVFPSLVHLWMDESYAVQSILESKQWFSDLLSALRALRHLTLLNLIRFCKRNEENVADIIAMTGLKYHHLETFTVVRAQSTIVIYYTEGEWSEIDNDTRVVLSVQKIVS